LERTFLSKNQTTALSSELNTSVKSLHGDEQSVTDCTNYVLVENHKLAGLPAGRHITVSDCLADVISVDRGSELASTDGVARSPVLSAGRRRPLGAPLLFRAAVVCLSVRLSPLKPCYLHRASPMSNTGVAAAAAAVEMLSVSGLARRRPAGASVEPTGDGRPSTGDGAPHRLIVREPRRR